MLSPYRPPSLLGGRGEVCLLAGGGERKKGDTEGFGILFFHKIHPFLSLTAEGCTAKEEE
jgi:hypothetical protein